jgi:exosortase A-associated hydrolase 2
VEGPVSGIVLQLPPFGEEMNKCRTMIARSARAFAARRFAVLEIDLLGCGDSTGSHADATLVRWNDNLREAIEWLAQRHSARIDWVWAVRAGALLVPTVLRSAHCASASMLLWQPLLQGVMLLNHLLRQKAASSFSDGADRMQLASLRERLVSGEGLEVGGYTISPALASELERARFEVPMASGRQIAWFEVDASEDPMLSPASRRTIEQLKSTGAKVRATPIHGVSFWQSVEIERCDDLIDASLAALSEESPDAVRRDAIAL